MAFQSLPLSEGLVTSRRASRLNVGELIRADDTYYKPADDSIWRGWGRTRYINSNGQVGGSSGKVIGMVFCPFDPAVDGLSDDFVVAHRTNKYYTSVFTARTGTFSGTTIDNVGTGTHLNACHANNKWYLFNGNNDGVANQVLKPGTSIPASRRHGLAPVATTPSSNTVSTAAGTWPADEAFWGEGRFFFFTTEVVGPGTSDELESAVSLGEPSHVDLQKDGTGAIPFDVTVVRHQTLANSTATEVRFYMVKASLNQAWDSSLLTRAFRVGSTSVSATYTNDKITLSGNYTFFNAVNNPTVTVVSGSISNPSFISRAYDNVAATVSIGNTAVVDLKNWGFAATAGAVIRGIKMWLRFRRSGGTVGPVVVTAQMIHPTGPTLGIAKGFNTSNTDYVLHTQPADSETDTWGLTLLGSDVNNSGFGVRLTISAVAGEAAIDAVDLRVYTSNLPTIGPAYPIIAVQQENVLVVQSANTPPPISATGDVIDGALVVDNVGNRRELAYSLPGKFDYFPLLYRIGIDSTEHDKVMVVRKVGDVGLVFMLNQVIRLNYVPYSTDPEFIPGRCYEAIIPDHGCTSRQGVALFQYTGGPILAAYVSHNGVYMNDGNRDQIMTEDIDWPATVDVTQLDKAVLTNYPKLHVLKLDFILAGSGATENNRFLLIHYHASHRKSGGRFKLTGPNVMRTACSCVAKIVSETVLLTGHATDARIYVEDNSVSDAEGTGINPIVETGEVYPNGRGQKVTVVRSWVDGLGGASGMTMTVTPRYRNGASAVVDHTAVTYTPSLEGMNLLQTHFGTIESVRYKLSLPDAGGSNAATSFAEIIHEFNAQGTALDPLT